MIVGVNIKLKEIILTYNCVSEEHMDVEHYDRTTLPPHEQRKEEETKKQLSKAEQAEAKLKCRDRKDDSHYKWIT